jgi:prophage DNA circulation protein
LQADIAVEVPKPKLNEIPATASPRQRAFLEKQNARMMSEYNGKVRKATEKARNTANEAKDAARAEIKQVGEGLKAAVTKARDDYNKNRKALSEKYSSDLKTELKNIEDKVR